MSLKKLTLNAEQDLIKLAHTLAHEEHRSISSMFSNFIKAKVQIKKRLLSTEEKNNNSFAPSTQKAIALGEKIHSKLPDNFNYKVEVENILNEKYGL